ncbi:MAG: Ig-like domain-containing protein [Fimbriimonas sp.]
MTLKRLIATAALATVCAVAFAQQAQIKLSAYPAMSVADGRSTTTITAEVRDSHGTLVPDGTRVVFESSLGNFRESIVQTRNGIARAILQAGGVPGVAVIKTTTMDGIAQPSTLDFEFVGDRSMLSAATDYIEIVSPTYMEYVPDTRIIAAASPNHGVSVRFRDITVLADDVQVNIFRNELRARKARLKIGKLDQEFEEIFIRLNEKTGIGSTRFKMVLPPPISFVGFMPVFLSDDPSRFKNLGQEVERFGLVEIKRDVLTPSKSREGAFRLEFEETGVYTSSIAAKKAVVFPQREIQFQRAEILVSGSRVMQMPLYQLNLMQSSSNGVMQSLVNVNNNQLQVNYPYYLSLKPGLTSLVRFRTGDRYGRGVGGSSAAFLDYEMNWNKGDQMDGKFTISGIGRKDMTLGIQHYLRIDDRTSAFGMIEMPANESIFGSLNLNRSYDGFSMSLNGNMNQTLRGIRRTTRDMSFAADKDPTKLGNLPVRLYVGLTAQESSNTLLGSSQSAVGLRARFQSLPIQLDNRSTFYAGLSLAHLTGRNTVNGLTMMGEASLTRRFSDSLRLTGTYSYLRDGYNDRFLGKNRFGLDASYDTDKFRLHVYGNKSIDVDRMSLFGDLKLNVTGNWWFSSYYTLERYLSNDFLDYSFGVGYVISGREIGLVWSKSTGRIGLQVLGASF